MARLEELARGAAVTGVVPDQAVVVVDVRWFGAAAIELTYKRHDGYRPSFYGPVRVCGVVREGYSGAHGFSRNYRYQPPDP